MSQNTKSSKISSSALKNIDSEIDLDNVINKLNDTLGNYLDIFNLYNTRVTTSQNEELVDNNDVRSLANRLAWSSENNSNLFVRVNDQGDWIEIISGEDKFRFRFVKYDHNNGGLLLFDNVRNVYVEIDGEQARVGNDLNSLSKMYTGSWIGLDSSQDLTNLFNTTGKYIYYFFYII